MLIVFRWRLLFIVFDIDVVVFVINVGIDCDRRDVAVGDRRSCLRHIALWAVVPLPC